VVDYVILSVTILAIGIIGLVTKHDLIKMLIAIEMITAAATMNFVVFGSLMKDPLGQAFSILALSVDACVTAVALALAVIIYRKLKIRDVRDLTELKE
jgi:NADH:ubiquinone oxidoreductase subunit K